MIDWYLDIGRLLRGIRQNSLQAATAYKDGDEPSARIYQNILKAQYKELKRVWGAFFDVGELGSLGRHISFGDEVDFRDILNSDIPPIEEKAEEHLQENRDVVEPLGFEELLHPAVANHAYQQYTDGHLRDSVLNAFVAVFDLIRARTGIDEDGARLVSQAFSLDNPVLIFSELVTESGRSDQKGFIQIYQGAFLGIRNPKAHSLIHDLTRLKAAQYLIFASLLARRVEESAFPA